METLKESILAAEWAGYRWALQHPDATADEFEDASEAYLPEHMSGVLAYAFERGWAMAREGKTPQSDNTGAVI
ncbi:hypothetical protein [Acidithiobacillus sp.]|uniref:hypothetical protein n=1 Tax=Acidithiobacillus sp. TaxID=1872118 RepID=UPI00258E1371|nr:hypothetical protein [Acidithiobacillus sp.]MDD5375430.1 hypothetical protein [Acidithiobacillus sp.]